MDLEHLKDIKPLKATTCAVCEKPLEQPLLSFPHFPLTEIYTPTKISEKVGFLDLHFHLCQHCGHGQLSNHIPPEILYQQSYHFRTSASATASKANDVFLEFIERMLGRRKIKNIIEIGCSDMYLLRALKPKADRLLGVDPILKGKEQELNDDKIEVKGTLFENLDLSSMDLRETMIVSSHTLEHLQNPKAIIQNVLHHADDSTIFFFQFPGFESLVQDSRFDQIFHQHLHYFSKYSFNYLLQELGGELLASAVNQQHWGSLLLAFRKKQKQSSTGEISQEEIHPETDPIKKITKEEVLQSYKLFQKQMWLTGQHLQSRESEVLVGYGAALMLPVLGYHLNLDFSEFAFIADDDKNKQGLFYVNLPVPIKNPSEITKPQSTTVVITAIDNSRQILPKALALHPKKIILPLGNV